MSINLYDILISKFVLLLKLYSLHLSPVKDVGNMFVYHLTLEQLCYGHMTQPKYMQWINQ